MSDTIIIHPTRTELAGGVPVLEVRLGGTQRGLVLLLTDASVPEIEVVEAMNTFALEGFESLAVQAAPGADGLAEERARAHGYTGEQIGVVGIGEGATLALHMARTRELGAAVSLSPAPDVSEVRAAPELRTPWLGLLGAESDDLGPQQVAELRTVLHEGSDVFSRVVVYPGVGPTSTGAARTASASRRRTTAGSARSSGSSPGWPRD